MNVEQKQHLSSLKQNCTVLIERIAFYNQSQIPYLIFIVKISLPLGYEFFLCLSKSPHLKH